MLAGNVICDRTDETAELHDTAGCRPNGSKYVFPTQEITMVRKKLVLSLLAVVLAAPGIHAQTAPAADAAAPAAANAVDPASIQALKDMGSHLQTLKRFHVSTELTGERVLADGQKLQHTATADMDVERPEPAARPDVERPGRTRTDLRRQDGHPLYPGAKVLLDHRVFRKPRRA